MAARITRQVRRKQPISVNIDGEASRAYAGETVASVLLAAGVTVFYRTRSGQPRGPYCNMGACFECQVKIDGDWQRACMTVAEDGMNITTGARKSAP